MRGHTPAIERVARVVVVLASGWFAFTAFWGLFGILGSGHLGAGSAGNAIAAEQIVKWHIAYPAWDWYTGQAPPKSAYICHHPFGQYWVPAFFIWLFGHHDAVVRLPAALMSSAMPPLLYGIARARWGAAAGAVAAAAFVVLPITVGFSQFLNLETFCIFGALLFFWGHTRHMATGKHRHLAASLVGLCFAFSGDWAGYLLVAPTMGWALLRAFVLPVRLTPRFALLPYARWWSLSVAVALASLLLWVVLFHHAGQLGDWMGAAETRGGGNGMKLGAVLEGRKNWIDFSFTPLAIRIGKIAAPVCLLRCLVLRRDEETYAPSLLFGAVAQYVGFKQGADVHIFWSHYFAPYFALALAQLAHTGASVIAFVVRRFSRRLAAPVAAWVTLVTGLGPVLAMTHDGVASLWVWRRTGGRYDDNGALIRSHVDLLTVVDQVINPATPRGTPIDTHPSAEFGWEYMWKYEGLGRFSTVPHASQVAPQSPFWVARASGMTGEEQRKVAGLGHVRVYGDAWLVDQREPVAPLDAYSMNESEPNWWQWLWHDTTDRRRTAATTSDPWLTWEWRTLVGQDAPLPPGEPATLDQMRIAHNVAVVGGDNPTAARWLATVEARLDRSVNARYDTGLQLLGVRVLGGVEPRVESWFLVGNGFLGDDVLAVRSSIDKEATLSLIPPDTVDREMAWPEPMATKLWKPRCIYVTTTVLNHRIGVERYTARWAPRDASPYPHPTDGKDLVLTILP